MNRSLGVLLITASFLISSCSGKVAAKEPEYAPDFELQDTRQDVFTLSEYKDKQSVLLFFWTTWCPFCRRELKVLNDSYASLIKNDIEVLAIDVGELSDAVSDFIRSYYLVFRVLLDKDTSVSKAYGVMGIPTYVLVNQKGAIVFRDNYFPANYKNLLYGKPTR